MVLKFFRSESTDRLEEIETRLISMLSDDRHSFDVASSALLAGADPDIVGPDLRETDHRVNEAEQMVRRELVVHASVHGSVDVPAVLVYMSIVKDIERIGDYAKNIYDIAADGADLSVDDDHDDLLALRDEISRSIGEVADVFGRRDSDRAREIIGRCDELQDDLDDLVSALVTSDAVASYAVPRALFFRHCKRVVAHLMNVLTSIVMPVDQLDYFDEDPEDRE
ncbi:MAG: PhoU domain-containing protein [Nitriliruptorales bacterium]|nr:PhoU domain-containing protein [Nitriliruptorales bacterium]